MSLNSNINEKHSKYVQVEQRVQVRHRSVKGKISKVMHEAKALRSVSELQRMMQADLALSSKGSWFSCLYVFDHISAKLG